MKQLLTILFILSFFAASAQDKKYAGEFENGIKYNWGAFVKGLHIPVIADTATIHDNSRWKDSAEIAIFQGELWYKLPKGYWKKPGGGNGGGGNTTPGSGVGVNLEWFGGVADGVTDNYPAIMAAKAFLKPLNGGVIHLHNGVWLVKSDIAIEQGNIAIIGESKEGTILKGDTTTGNTIRLTNLRQDPLYWKGFISDTSTAYTYKNSTKRGDGFIALKSAAWADSFKVGQNIFILGGSHYYNQEFGEHNTVIRKHLDTLFLKYNLSRDYAVEKCIYGGQLAQDYTIPAVGDTASAYFTAGNAPTGVNRFFSLGNNLFIVINTVGDRAVLKNAGRGNVTGVLPAGTTCSKGRTLIINDHTSNFTLQNLTLLGTSGNARVLNVDNSFHVLVQNVIVKRAPVVADIDGWTHSVDCTRDVVFDHVDFIDMSNKFTQQVSRSTGDCKYLYCTLNHPLDISEMTFNTLVDHCRFNIKGYDFGIRMGKSITSAFFTNNKLNVDGVPLGAINMDDIQDPVNIQRDGVVMDNNDITIAGNSNVMNIAGGGINQFTNNRVVGQIGTIAAFLNSVTGLVDGADFNTIVSGNYFKGTFNNFLFNIGSKGTVTNNDFVNTDTTTSGIGGLRYNLFFSNSFDTGKAVNFIFRNNNFKNWYYKANGQQINFTIDDHLDIYNNYFTGAKGDATTPDFVWNVHNRAGGNSFSGTAPTLNTTQQAYPYTGYTVNTHRKVGFQFSDNGDGTVSIQAAFLDGGAQINVTPGALMTTEGQTIITSDGQTIIFN